VTERIQVLGLCRFSYPSAPGAFDDGGETLEALRARLYAPRRLALRFLWFEHVALPCLRRQTDPDFRLLLLAGDAMPAHWRARLEVLVADVPQIVPLFLPEGRVHREVCREAMRAHREPGAHAVAEFRLDDDDAVADVFVARARKVFRHVRQLYAMRPRAAVDFSRGLLLRATPSGIELAPVIAQHWTPGLVTFRRPDDEASLLDANHTKLWKTMPELLMPFPVMYVRGAHEDNASDLERRWDRVDRWQAGADELRDLASGSFGLDLPKFEAALAEWRSAG
jgi:hypothetical protein